jgi:uncharacterized HhH-GPD family protein
MALHLTGDSDADALLDQSPLALLLGMTLDQQVPMERAFGAPALLAERIGSDLDAGEIAAMDPERLAAVFSATPALHRFPGSMATRCQQVCQAIVDSYGGDASALWTTAADGPELLRRMKALPGFGEMKAKIFIALLGKQRGLTVPGWEAVSTPYSEPGSTRSVADIVDRESLIAVREFKSTMKAQAKRASK